MTEEGGKQNSETANKPTKDILSTFTCRLHSLQDTAKCAAAASLLHKRRPEEVKGIKLRILYLGRCICPLGRPRIARAELRECDAESALFNPSTLASLSTHGRGRTALDASSNYCAPPPPPPPSSQLWQSNQAWQWRPRP